MASPVTISNLTPVLDSGQEHPAAPAVDYVTINSVLNDLCALPSIQNLIEDLDAKRRKARAGRRGYSPRTMLRLAIARHLIPERFVTRFIRRLRMSPRLRVICGLKDDRIPCESTFSKFARRLCESVTRLESAHSELVELLRDYFPELGARLSIDSTDVPAYSRPFRKQGPSDPDARLGVRTAKNKSVGDGGKPKKMEHFFGYKSHLVCDATVGIPLTQVFLPADRPDTTQLPVVMDKATKAYPWLEPTVLMADRGYDATANFTYLTERNVEPVILSRRPTAADELYGGVFTKNGTMLCDDGETEMEYLESKGEWHKFGCPATGCAMREKSNGSMQFCDVKALWVKSTPDNVRALGWKVAKASAEWQSLYAERPIVERLFASLKTSRILNQHQYRGKNKVEAHTLLALLGYTGTMLGRARAGEFDAIRDMRLNLG